MRATRHALLLAVLLTAGAPGAPLVVVGAVEDVVVGGDAVPVVDTSPPKRPFVPRDTPLPDGWVPGKDGMAGTGPQLWSADFESGDLTGRRGPQPHRRPT